MRYLYVLSETPDRRPCSNSHQSNKGVRYMLSETPHRRPHSHCHQATKGMRHVLSETPDCRPHQKAIKQTKKCDIYYMLSETSDRRPHSHSHSKRRSSTLTPSTINSTDKHLDHFMVSTFFLNFKGNHPLPHQRTIPILLEHNGNGVFGYLHN
jgi:hypothetical protein